MSSSAEMPNFETLALERVDDHVTVIRLNRPDASNALNTQMGRDLVRCFEDVALDPKNLRCIVLTGTGDKAFCAGGDLKEFIHMVTQNIGELSASGGTQTFGGDVPVNASLVAVLREVEIYKPIIAAVNGFCIAGGMEMLQGTDIRIASENASFGIGEPRRGLFPGGGSTTKLPRQIAFAHAMEILLTAEPISARKAYEYGIVNEVVPFDQLMPTAIKYAELICQNGPLAVRKVKESVLKGLALPFKEALDQEMAFSGEVFSTEDAMEGIQAFQQKRKPNWKGR